MSAMRPPEAGSVDADTWVGLTADVLPVDEVSTWVVRADCGGSVVFTGTVRDHAEGRPGVSRLEYEAYESQVTPRLQAIADRARQRWPELARVALLHRTGALGVGEASVVVAVSSPHRGDSFEAARWCIDTLKGSVPIWKRETWEGGEAWGLDATDIAEIDGVDEHVPERAS